MVSIYPLCVVPAVGPGDCFRSPNRQPGNVALGIDENSSGKLLTFHVREGLVNRVFEDEAEVRRFLDLRSFRSVVRTLVAASRNARRSQAARFLTLLKSHGTWERRLESPCICMPSKLGRQCR